MLSARSGTLAIACALLIGGTGGSLGCKRHGDKATSSGTATTQVPSPQDDADDQLADKLDAYIICLNTLSAPVHASRARYFSWVDPKKGVTGNERVVLGLFELPDDAVRKCTLGLEKAQRMSPSDTKLEAAGDEFANAVRSVETVTGEIFSYYETNAFKDDKLARGKAAHPRLVLAFAAFSKADAALHSVLEGMVKPLSERTLARIEREDGRKFRWHRKSVLNRARELVEAGDAVGDDDDVDAARVATAFDAYDRALVDSTTFGAAHRRDLVPPASTSFDQFSKAAEDYRTKAREYVRCLRAAPAKAKAANGKVNLDKLPTCADGRPRDVVQKYNDLVRTSNERPFP